MRQRNNTSPVNTESGFTLIEVLIAMVLLTIGMIGYTSFSGNLINKNSLQERKTLATTLAREKIEDLRSIAIQTDLVAANSTNGTTVFGDALDRQGNRIGDEGTTGAIYTRTWLINDTNAPLVVATVNVAWDSSSGTRSISLSTQFQQ